MEGCIQEVQEALEKDEQGALKDAGLVGAALRVEHYEIAGYTAAIAIAKTLGLKEIAALLNESLNEEKDASKNILVGAKPILKAAESQEDPDEEKEEKKPKSAKEQQSARESEQDEKEAAPEMGSAKKAS
ncbi:MAG: hypothetical protein NVSMB3_01670 [Acidobacteriaceae bacterium]